MSGLTPLLHMVLASMSDDPNAQSIDAVDTTRTSRRSTDSLALLEQRVANLESHVGAGGKATEQDPVESGAPSNSQVSTSSVAADLRDELESFERMYNGLELRVNDLEKEFDGGGGRQLSSEIDESRSRKVDTMTKAFDAFVAETQRRFDRLEEAIRPFNDYSAGVSGAVEKLAKLETAIRDWSSGKGARAIQDRFAKQESELRAVQAKLAGLQSHSHPVANGSAQAVSTVGSGRRDRPAQVSTPHAHSEQSNAISTQTNSDFNGMVPHDQRESNGQPHEPDGRPTKRRRVGRIPKSSHTIIKTKRRGRIPIKNPVHGVGRPFRYIPTFKMY